MKFQQTLKRILQKPRTSFHVGMAILKGCYYIVYYRLFRRNVRIRFPFKAYARVTICGPGSVFIDRNCAVHRNVFKGLKIVTFSLHAKVVIGQRCSLGGLTVRCHGTVEIGEETMFANSLVQDSLFTEVGKIRSIIKHNHVASSKPISIGKNVWLASQSCVLGGSIIGDHSVIASGSLCYDFKVEEYSLGMGSPISKNLSIDALMGLMGT